MPSHCFVGVCFVRLDSTGPVFFGFEEYLGGLALMVLAWTIADIRYRFRVRTAPLPLRGLSFGVVASVGVLTLLTDLWRAAEWWVPEGNILSPAVWQAILGGLFLATFLTWAWFALMRPPVFGARNARRYGQTLYRVILKGSPAELAVIADEFTFSAKAIVNHAPQRVDLLRNGVQERNGAKNTHEPSEASLYAHDICLLIADRRFCRAIVEASPGTALALFQEMRATSKFGIGIDSFAKNIVQEALANHDSFLYHETEGYSSGLLGYHKPLSRAMFGNHRMVEDIGSLLDPDYRSMRRWDSSQWEAYCRVVLMTFGDYVTNGLGEHSFVLFRAMKNIEHAVSDLYKVNGRADSAFDDDIQARLRVVVQFIEDALAILSKAEVPKYISLRTRKRHGAGSPYDHLAEMIVEVIDSASAVQSPVDLCWWVQHNSVWGEFFNFGKDESAAARIVQHKVRRRLFDHIKEMERFPNFQGARILGFCLNVMGLALSEKEHDRDSRALQKAVLSWTKRHYAWLHSYNPRVAQACLVDGLTYDADGRQIVKTYPADGLTRTPVHVRLDVDPASPDAAAPDGGTEEAPPGG